MDPPRKTLVILRIAEGCHAPELLREAGVSEDMIYSVCSHGYGLCSDLEPLHLMEKILFACDELTGLIGTLQNIPLLAASPYLSLF